MSDNTDLEQSNAMLQYHVAHIGLDLEDIKQASLEFRTAAANLVALLRLRYGPTSEPGLSLALEELERFLRTSRSPVSSTDNPKGDQ